MVDFLDDVTFKICDVMSCVLCAAVDAAESSATLGH